MRQIARVLGTSHTTVARHVARLGRHCLLFHEQVRRSLRPPAVIAVDGFESFELSQYHPFHFHLAVDCTSSLFLHFTDSPLRRKGTMTPSQRAKREALEGRFGRADPRAVRKDMRELLAVVTASADEVIVRSDGHRSYPPAIRQIRAVVRHETTRSDDYRDRHNPLYEINLLDLLIRHGMANHKRETIAWAKRRHGAALRLAIFLVWRNYIKLRRERRCVATPAMMIGLLDRGLTEEDILARRLFVSRVELSEAWRDYYWRRVRTRPLAVNRVHELKFAA